MLTFFNSLYLVNCALNMSDRSSCNPGRRTDRQEVKGDAFMDVRIW